jgi:NAD(P)-dependent dehydrogenase (short-subunit alcohol dehydrogenase family)
MSGVRAAARQDRQGGPATGQGRAVLITGASTGIGAACALRLDRQGWQVFAGVRRAGDGERLQRRASPRLQPLLLDVTDLAQVAAAIARVQAARGSRGLDGLVNNAGIVVAAPLEFLPPERLRAQLEVNVTGALAVTQAALPLLRPRRGRIVNIGSVSGLLAQPFTGAYSASKFALEALSDALRMELRPWGIEVVLVEPGAIATPLWEKSVQAADTLLAGLPPEAHALYGPAITVLRGRVGRLTHALPPDSVARVVAAALTVRRPRTRYLVGRDARAGALAARLLPDRLRDVLLLRLSGLPRSAPRPRV